MKAIGNQLSRLFLRTIIFAFAAVFTLAACKSDKKSGGEKQKQEQTTTEKEKAQKADDDQKKELEYPVPTPYKVTTMLNKAGASYVLSLSNDMENADAYLRDWKKALNLGVYGADLSYASTYNQTQETMDYLKTSEELTNDLGIQSAIDQKLINRVERNINNTDSLHKIISNSYHDTFEFLNKNDKGDISVLVLAGAWIEGLYLSTHLVAENPEEIMKGVADQKSVLKKLMRVINEYKGESDHIDRIISDLKEIVAVYDEANVSEGNKNFTEQQFDKLANKAKEIRNRIVSK